MRDNIAAAGRSGGASLLLALAAVVISMLPTQAIEALQYDRTLVLSGQVQRLLTAHWTHWNADHFLWDVATFVILGIACERRDRRRMLATLAIAATVIPLGLLFLQPDLGFYRGLSGLDSALFALLAVGVLRDRIATRPWGLIVSIAAVGAGFFAKTCIELAFGASVFVDAHAAEFAPVPLAHLIGAACGAIVAAWPAITRTSTTVVSPVLQPVASSTS
jgi:rhomboid family GlyGly-CTERM serine protease